MRFFVAMAWVVLAGASCRRAGSTSTSTSPDAGRPADYVHQLSVKVPGADVSADGGPVVRFVAVGDTGHGNEAQRAVGQAIATICNGQGCDFVVLLGDNFYPTGVTGTGDPQFQSKFIEPYGAVDAPFYAVLGNHDYGGNGSGNELDKGQAQIDYSRINPKWRLPAADYHFTVRHADFFIADTNRSFYALDDQARADFERWLPAATGRWKIAFGHHTLRSNGRHGNAGSYDGVPSAVPIAPGAGVKRFLEDEVCGRADAYLCGHEHILEWLKDTCTRPGAGFGTELLISGGGSSATGFAKDPTNEDWWRASVPGFVYVVLDGDVWTGTYYDEHAAPLYSRTLTRPSLTADAGTGRQ